MMLKWNHRVVLAGALAGAVAVAGCGDVSRTGRAPAQVVIEKLEAASGAAPDEFFGSLASDVLTMRTQPAPCSEASPCPTVFNDFGKATMSLVMKDPGQPGFPSSPSALNTVTFSRYRVEYMRTDGHNIQGVDVPYAFDSAATFTVPVNGSVAGAFEIVRTIAKSEAPLQALVSQAKTIQTIAKVTFYGRDQAGNEVIATGNIGISFGNFADPAQ